MTSPAKGGSYVRQADGSLRRVEGTEPRTNSSRTGDEAEAEAQPAGTTAKPSRKAKE